MNTDSDHPPLFAASPLVNAVIAYKLQALVHSTKEMRGMSDRLGVES